MKLVTVYNQGDGSVAVWQSEDQRGLFKVVYGKDEQKNLTYEQAVTAFGRCVFHSLACAGKLNNEGR